MKEMTMQEWTDKFPQRLAFLLEQSNMSQKELAETIGVTEVSMSRYANGNRIPKAPTIVNMARALKVPVSWLLIIDDDMKPSGGKCDRFLK